MLKLDSLDFERLTAGDELAMERVLVIVGTLGPDVACELTVVDWRGVAEARRYAVMRGVVCEAPFGLDSTGTKTSVDSDNGWTSKAEYVPKGPCSPEILVTGPMTTLMSLLEPVTVVTNASDMSTTDVLEILDSHSCV